MKSTILRAILVVVFLYLGTTNLFSQWFLGRYDYSIGFGINAAQFHGDLSNRVNSAFYNTPFSKYFYEGRRPGFSLTAEKGLGPYFSIKGNLIYSKLYGARLSTDQYFNANIFEYSVVGTLNFSNMFWGIDRRRIPVFYGFFGIGFTESRTWRYTDYNDSLVGTNGFGNPKVEGGRYIPMTETIMPMGLGVKFVFNEETALYLEASIRPINTDLLDDIISNDSWVEGYGNVTVGFDYYFSLNKKSAYRRHTSSYSYRNYSSVNKRNYAKKNKKIFKNGKKRLKYKRR